MTDEEFRKLCDDFNKMAEELNDLKLIFSSVDNHLHEVCDKFDDLTVVNDNNNVELLKNEQL